MAYDPILKITVYSHSFKVYDISLMAGLILPSFLGELTSSTVNRKPGGIVVSETSKEFYVFNKAAGEYFIHLNLLPKFINLLRQWKVMDNQYTINYYNRREAADLNIELRPEWKLRDYQEPIAEYVTKFNKDKTPQTAVDRCKFIGMQTGKGKGITSVVAAVKIGKRIVFVIQPKYTDKWFEEIQKYTTATKKDILVISGSKHMANMVSFANDEDYTQSIIIISSVTFRQFISAYEEDKNYCLEKYGILPIDFFEHIGAGTLILDEVHEAFNFSFKLCVQSNIDLIVGLSATLMNYDTFMERMYEIAFPIAERADKLEDDKYIIVHPVAYKMFNPRIARTTEWGQTTYSHNAFEESIIRNKHALANYLTLIEFIVKIGYLDKKKEPKDKFRIYATKISMCTLIRDHLRKVFPQLTIERFVGEDDYENMILPDIACTTIGSGGTGHDIPGLIGTLNTVNILSIQSNRQVLGRLRKIEGRDVHYYCLYCEDIPKHREFNLRRIDAFKPVCAKISEIYYGKPI